MPAASDSARLVPKRSDIAKENVVSDGKAKWDSPENKVSSRPDEPGELARKHGISPDRAQMLIDRYGHDPEQLDAAAKRLKPRI